MTLGVLFQTYAQNFHDLRLFNKWNINTAIEVLLELLQVLKPAKKNYGKQKALQQ